MSAFLPQQAKRHSRCQRMTQQAIFHALTLTVVYHPGPPGIPPQVIFYYILLARRLLDRANAAAMAGKGLLNAL